MNKPKQIRSKVMLERAAIEAIAAAKCGMDNNVARDWGGVSARTGEPLSDGQILYRLKVGKQLEGYEKGDGYRKAWRQGRSPYANLVRRAVISVARQDYQTQIVAQIEHVKPRVVSGQRFEQRERAKAARYERTHSRAA